MWYRAFHAVSRLDTHASAAISYRLVSRLASSRHSTATTPTAAPYPHLYLIRSFPSLNLFCPIGYPLPHTALTWNVPPTGLAHPHSHHLLLFALKAALCSTHVPRHDSGLTHRKPTLKLALLAVIVDHALPMKCEFKFMMMAWSSFPSCLALMWMLHTLLH